MKHLIIINYNAKITEMRDGCHMHNKPFIIYQDELSLFGISQNNTLKISEVHIWSKCIKSSLYKKAIDKLGVKRYSYFLIWGEDTSMVFILFSLAESYRYIDKYGIFRFNRKLSASNKISNSNKMFGKIFFLDIVFDFTKNNVKSKKFAMYQAINIRNNKLFNSLSKFNKNYLNLIIKKLLASNYINKNDKEKLIFMFFK